MPFHFQRLRIPEVMLIEPKVFQDTRGFFLELFKKSEFETNGIKDNFVQDNYSHSTKGTLRGLHYQKQPAAQGKLITVFRGEVFDVAVDIRKGSPTFGQWVGVKLSDEKFQMLYIPAGFAHGFCVLSAEVDFIYKVTAEYAPTLDRGIIWNDPTINIDWPTKNPLLSSKDQRLPLLQDADHDFVY